MERRFDEWEAPLISERLSRPLNGSRGQQGRTEASVASEPATRVGQDRRERRTAVPSTGVAQAQAGVKVCRPLLGEVTRNDFAQNTAQAEP
jgi:hypothetical protein